MSEHECQRCGETYEVAADGDSFTTITISYHDDDREDFAESVCEECGDELLGDVVEDLEVSIHG